MSEDVPVEFVVEKGTYTDKGRGAEESHRREFDSRGRQETCRHQKESEVTPVDKYT